MASAVKIALFLFLIATIVTAFFLLPIEKISKDFLVWIKQDLGPWGPLVLAVTYIPLSVLAVPASVLTIILLLRLVPLLPFTPVHIGEYMLASWLGMMPITFALVYVGTTLKDLSDITDGGNKTSKSHWVFITMGIGLSVIRIDAGVVVFWFLFVRRDSDGLRHQNCEGLSGQSTG